MTTYDIPAMRREAEDIAHRRPDVIRSEAMAMHPSNVHEHRPVVCGNWSDPTDAGDGQQLVIAHARCAVCRRPIVQVQRRNQPTDPADDWPLGDHLIGATSWSLTP